MDRGRLTLIQWRGKLEPVSSQLPFSHMLPSKQGINSAISSPKIHPLLKETFKIPQKGIYLSQRRSQSHPPNQWSSDTPASAHYQAKLALVHCTTTDTQTPKSNTLVCLEADKFPPETLQFYHLQRQRAELGRLFAIRIHFGLADEQIRDVSVDVRGEHKRSTGFLLMLHKSRGVAVTG